MPSALRPQRETEEVKFVYSFVYFSIYRSLRLTQQYFLFPPSYLKFASEWPRPLVLLSLTFSVVYLSLSEYHLWDPT